MTTAVENDNKIHVCHFNGRKNDTKSIRYTQGIVRISLL